MYRKNSDDSLKKTGDGGDSHHHHLNHLHHHHHQFRSLKENGGKGIQDELIEIINDFKNNVFTISEVEKLVEDWRNRNDVQQSFKEKQVPPGNVYNE